MIKFLYIYDMSVKNLLKILSMNMKAIQDMSKIAIPQRV